MLTTYKNYTSLIFLISPVFMSLCMKVCKESIIILGIAYSKNLTPFIYINITHLPNRSISVCMNSCVRTMNP